MKAIADYLVFLGIILGCPIGYYFCKFKFRKEIKNAEQNRKDSTCQSQKQ